MKRLFTYGTLCCPEVFELVVGRLLPSENAVLSDFECLLLEGEVYPGITECPGKKVAGKLFSGLTSADFDLLDAYEEELYVRCECSVSTASGKLVSAECYEIRTSARHRLSRAPWSQSDFERFHLVGYLQLLRS